MTTRFRVLILVGAASGLLGLAACATEAPTPVSPTATAEPPSALAPGEETYAVAECPLSEGEVKQTCQRFNAGKEEEQMIDYFIPGQIYSTQPLTACGCPGVTICLDEDCPRLTNRPFLQQEVLHSVTLQGSHCRQLCRSTTGGTGTEYQECLAICREHHD